MIGAHTIGLVRDTFGTGLGNPWVLNGADDFAGGPVFDNEYFKFGIDTIEANTCSAFANNPTPFSRVFPTWFQQSNFPSQGLGLDWLDTDISLMMPSTDETPSGHPNFRGFSEAFAANNTVFLDTFFPAFDKLTKLGVDPKKLSPATTSCACGSRRLTQVERHLVGYSGALTANDLFALARGFGDAMARATMTTIKWQCMREDEIIWLTTETNVTASTGPTMAPSSATTSPDSGPTAFDGRRALRAEKRFQGGIW